MLNKMDFKIFFNGNEFLIKRSTCIESVIGKRLLFFSYGSGAASAMFSATVGDVDLSNSGIKSLVLYDRSEIC